MKNPAVVVGAAAFLVVAGFAVGLLVGPQRTAEEGRSRISSASPPLGTSRPADPVVSTTETPPAERTLEKLRERVVELELELRIALEESGKKSPTESSADLARRAFEDLLAMEMEEEWDPERLRSLIDHLSKLDGKLAQYFVDRFRTAQAANGSDSEKKVALQLALMSGGPEAADFIQQLLTDATLDPSLRDRLLSELSPHGGSFFSIRRLPVSESLGSTAMLLVHSDNPTERRAGAGVLGGVRTSGSRNELLRLIQDPDSVVKETAVRSLGLIGDATTRKLLETYAAQTADPSLQKAAAAAIRDLDQGPR